MSASVDRDSFFERVYQVVARVPRGRVVTYGQIARHLGAPGAARTVGWALRQCPAYLPWHRVVNARGEISRRGDREWESIQRQLLEAEGVAFDDADRIDLAIYRWRP